jgi:hypothetical protein
MKFTGRLLCALIGLAALVATCALFQALLPPVIPVGIAGKLKYFTEHKDEFDTLFVGTSHFYYAISPEIFDDLTRKNGRPTRSFNFGIDGMHPPENLYVLDQILKTRPQNLKWVFIEVSDVQVKWTENLRSHRLVYWHDWPRTGLTLRKILNPRGEAPWFGKVARLWLARTNLETNLSLFARQFSNMGRGFDFIFSQTQQDPAQVASELGLRSDGYRIAGGGMSPENAARFKKALEREAMDARPKIIDPTTDAAYREAAEKTRRIGAAMIFVVTPVFSQERVQFRQPAPPESLLWFNSNKTYPQLYDPAVRVDDGHLSTEGAETFTRLLAQQFVDKTNQK